MQTAGLTSGTYYYSESAQSVPLELKQTGVELEFIIQVTYVYSARFGFFYDNNILSKVSSIVYR